ncbi:MAG: hypothetical protein ABID87_05590 [Chloroflexota bacterium]
MKRPPWVLMIITLAGITVLLPNGTFWEIASFFILVTVSIIGIIGWIIKFRKDRKRKRIKTTLVEYLEEGQNIKDKCFVKGQEAPENEANIWTSKVYNYLKDNLGLDYAERFQSHDGLPTGFTTLSGDKARVASFLRTRIARLTEFLSELARMN